MHIDNMLFSDSESEMEEADIGQLAIKLQDKGHVSHKIKNGANIFGQFFQRQKTDEEKLNDELNLDEFLLGPDDIVANPLEEE